MTTSRKLWISESDTRASIGGKSAGTESDESSSTAPERDQRQREFMIFWARLEAATQEAGARDPLDWAAAKANVAKQSLRNLKTAQKAPGLDILRRLSAASGRSINWWIGDAEIAQADDADFAYIPREPREGEGKLLTFAFRRYWIDHYLKAQPTTLRVYRIDDDVMSSTFEEGDNVLVNTEIANFKDGLYAVSIAGTPVLRRIQFLPQARAIVKPDNPKYDSFEVSLDAEPFDFAFIGIPVWYSRMI